MGQKFKIKIPDTFLGALLVIVLSTLPYFHEIITNSEGLKSWVPNLGIEQFLTDSNGNILGFSSYRVFLFTLLLFVFATIGWVGWYKSSKNRFYSLSILLVSCSGIYHVILILLNLRRSVLNSPEVKIVALLFLFVILCYLVVKKYGSSIRKALILIVLFILTLLPFYHDLLTDRAGNLMGWVPNLGIESVLTDNAGKVRGLVNYRILVYLFCVYLYSHLGWAGWFMDAKGRRYRPFLLVPASLSLYYVVIIAMSWQETKFNSPNIKLYITIGLSILLALNFYYNNKVSPKTNTVTENE